MKDSFEQEDERPRYRSTRHHRTWWTGVSRQVWLHTYIIVV